MIDWVDAALLALIQGLTEFLPVSSSGHLVLAQALVGTATPPLVYDLVLHGGTMLAVLITFRRDLVRLVQGCIDRGPEGARARRYVAAIAVASIPTALVGLILEDVAAEAFASPRAAGVGLIVTALVLAAGARRLPAAAVDAGWDLGEVAPQGITWRQAALVGLAQGLAVIPGVSRSGSTIVTALLLDLDRREAFRFSFLISLPAIGGGLLLKLDDVQLAAQGSLPVYVFGALAAGLVGLVALRLLRITLNATWLRGFGLYCLAAGATTLLVVGLN